ncbi:hypothetical protein EWM64_g10484 [Hericium alpestre]|uniref:Uncharacterized protein n=1 Tax=Hericium alpestre TaxID=135208 RepID=A0A4Y9ZIH0_9AGAM|nr:hypothetical protein EWM64_g10484 [Hericium alpestre]
MSSHSAEHQKPPEHDHARDAHVVGLRTALGSILSPKRPPLSHSISQSHTHSGTASPAATYTPPPVRAGFPLPSPSLKHDSQRIASSPPDLPVPAEHDHEHDHDHEHETENEHEHEHERERARFLATLQSKRAWDAMVHGSWM